MRGGSVGSVDWSTRTRPVSRSRLKVAVEVIADRVDSEPPRFLPAGGGEGVEHKIGEQFDLAVRRRADHPRLDVAMPVRRDVNRTPPRVELEHVVSLTTVVFS